MKRTTSIPMKNEKKELLIFLLITFGLPFLMGIPLAILSMRGRNTFSFVAVQMFYPAAGLMLARLMCNQEKSFLIPKTLFTGFLLLTGLMILWCFTSFFLPDESVVKGIHSLLVFGSGIVLLLLFVEPVEKRRAYGLNSKHWKLSILLLVLLMALYVYGFLVYNIGAGNFAQWLGSSWTSYLLFVLATFHLSFLFAFSSMFGEEYGWRVYLQPLLQQKFGLIKGVLVFGVLWECWHLPLVLFYYAPMESITSIAPLLQFMLARYISSISLAIFMAYAYMRTHNLWLPVLIRLVNHHLLAFGAIIWQDNGTMLIALALIQLVLFLPFLFSKVFRKPKLLSNNRPLQG